MATAVEMTARKRLTAEGNPSPSSHVQRRCGDMKVNSPSLAVQAEWCVVFERKALVTRCIGESRDDEYCEMCLSGFIYLGGVVCWIVD
jgi:hypothetical protein